MDLFTNLEVTDYSSDSPRERLRKCSRPKSLSDRQILPSEGLKQPNILVQNLLADDTSCLALPVISRVASLDFRVITGSQRREEREMNMETNEKGAKTRPTGQSTDTSSLRDVPKTAISPLFDTPLVAASRKQPCLSGLIRLNPA